MRALALFALAVTATVAQAEPVHPCKYDVFTPFGFEREIARGLPFLDVSALSTHITLPRAATYPQRSLLVRDGHIVGQIESSHDVRSGRFAVVITDGAGVELLKVVESEALCGVPGGDGICKLIEISTEQQPVMADVTAFSVRLDPRSTEPRYMRYGVRSSFHEWRVELLEAFHWVANVLDTTDSGYPPVTATDTEKLFWSLASEPDLVPYVPRLAISETTGHLVIRGVVPSNYIYDLIVQSAITAGYYQFDPQLVIDTGSDVLSVRGPTMTSCML